MGSHSSTIEFAYNRTMHYSIGKSPFEVICGVNLTAPLDLVPHSTITQFSGDTYERAKQIKKFHESVKATIEKQNKKYMQAANKHKKHVEFNEGDLTCIHLRK